MSSLLKQPIGCALALCSNFVKKQLTGCATRDLRSASGWRDSWLIVGHQKNVAFHGPRHPEGTTMRFTSIVAIAVACQALIARETGDNQCFQPLSILLLSEPARLNATC
jgi:hypothetical protein